MGTEEGEVVELRNGVVVVKLEAGMRCMTCAARGACQAFGTGVRRIEVPSRGEVKPGQHVVLKYKSQSRILSALLVFLVPIAGLVGGFAVGVELFGSQGAGVLGAFLGLGVGFGVLRLIDKVLAKQATFLPEIVEQEGP